MKSYLIFLILVITTTVSAHVLRDSLPFKLNEYFLALTSLKNFNGNVLIAKEGHILLDQTYNMSPAGVDSLHVSKDSKFIIASVSKVFIKYSILKLAEQNKLTLSDKLSKFIPDFPNGNKITIDQLMHHQSGLPRELTGYEKYDSLSLQKVVELSKLEKLQFEPGSQTLYSNVGYFLLHYIIDKTSGNGYLAFIQEEIFDKMKLENTAEFNSRTSISNFAYGFDSEEGKIVATSKKNINRFETGNYYSTISDLYSFSQQFLTGKYLTKAFAMQMVGPDSVLIQAGGRPGYRAYFYINLKNNVTFIFVANYTDIPIQEATAGIVNIIDNKPYEIPHKIKRVEINLPAKILKRYTGIFALEADQTQTFTIQSVNNGMLVTDEDGEKTEIKPDSETTFFQNPASKDGYVFTLNPHTNKYDLTIISTGVKLKTKRLK